MSYCLVIAEFCCCVVNMSSAWWTDCS